MKKILPICLILITLAIYSNAQEIRVKNPDNQIRKELISIPYKQFKNHFKVDSAFSVFDENNKPIAYQLEKLGNPEPVNVLIQVTVPALGSVKYKVNKSSPIPISPKTYARYVPERFDDFAWENDVVAFRLYGKALEGRKDDGQGMDYWAKRTDQLIINKWYKVENYHQDHGEGMDYYTVGQTLGAGDVGLYLNNELTYTKHYRRYRILDNGPLRTTFVLEYDPETRSGQQISMNKTISLDAGSHFNKIVFEVNNNQFNSTAIAIGIVKRKEEEPLITIGAKNQTVAYWEPEIGSNGQTGVAIIIPEQKVEYLGNNPNQILLISSVKNNRTFVYYNGAAWNRAGKITNAEDWNKVVKQEKSKIDKPLRVRLH